ncbi:MAG: hypothetical protein V1791_09255, partial [Pseudomonadota bacterium]
MKIMILLTRYASLFTRYALLAVPLLAASAFAGDLTTDNLTVSNDAAIHGTLTVGLSTNAGPTGGTITTEGGYRIHTFLSSGTFEVSSGSLTCDVLVVAGGGGGGTEIGGGGGAGGLVYTSGYVIATSSNTVTVGAGGAAFASGNNSVFGSITAIGGGRGASHGFGHAWAAATGGSGGGGEAQTYLT